jgi:ATP-dependent Clp protease ATP-binding subunit ClpA
MAFRFDKFTIKAQEAVQAAVELAGSQGNPQVTPVHLLQTLLSEREGIVRPLLEKIGADRGHLELGLRLAHLVALLDRNGRVLEAVLDEDHAAAWLQRVEDRLHHLARMRELVVRVDEEHHIHRVRLEAAVVDLAEDGHHIVKLHLERALGDDVEHLALDVGAVDHALGHHRRHAHREVAAARADVGDGVGGLQLECVDEEVGALLALALGALEPADAEVAHDLRDLAAHVGAAAAAFAALAGAVELREVVLRARARRFAGRLGRCGRLARLWNHAASRLGVGCWRGCRGGRRSRAFGAIAGGERNRPAHKERGDRGVADGVHGVSRSAACAGPPKP